MCDLQDAQGSKYFWPAAWKMSNHSAETAKQAIIVLGNDSYKLGKKKTDQAIVNMLQYVHSSPNDSMLLASEIMQFSSRVTYLPLSNPLVDRSIHETIGSDKEGKHLVA